MPLHCELCSSSTSNTLSLEPSLGVVSGNITGTSSDVRRNGVTSISRTSGMRLTHLSDISRTQIEAFSQRSQMIEAALDSRGKSRADASTLEKQVIALATRPKKDRLTGRDKQLLMAHWKEKSAVVGIRYDSGERRPANTQPREETARESLDFAIAHLTERQSVMLDSLLMTTAMQHAVGRATHHELRSELAKRIAMGEVIAEQPCSPGKGEPRYTTDTAWKTEQAILRMEREGRNTLPAIMAPAHADHTLASTDLNHGQREAARMVLTGAHRLSGIQGSAGVGKSHLIKTTAKIAEQQDYRMVVLAPYANQVERLQADGLKASTLATFLVAKDKNIDDRTVIVIDEAGLVPTRQMTT